MLDILNNHSASTGLDALLSYGKDGLLDRLEKWTCFHAERGEMCGLQDGPAALGSLLDAVADLASLPDTASDEAADASLAAAHEAIWDAKHAADTDTLHGDDAVAQCKEVEESDLRELLRAWAGLELLRRAARDGQITNDSAMAQAGIIMFEAPGYPN